MNGVFNLRRGAVTLLPAQACDAQGSALRRPILPELEEKGRDVKVNPRWLRVLIVGMKLLVNCQNVLVNVEVLVFTKIRLLHTDAPDFHFLAAARDAKLALASPIASPASASPGGHKPKAPSAVHVLDRTNGTTCHSPGVRLQAVCCLACVFLTPVFIVRASALWLAAIESVPSVTSSKSDCFIPKLGFKKKKKIERCLVHSAVGFDLNVTGV